MKCGKHVFAAAVISIPLIVLAAAPAIAVDWDAVPVQNIKLLYPAQTSFEWSLTMKDHSAAKKFKEGKNCKDCHLDEEEKYGGPLAEGKRWEPSPIPGKRGAVPMKLQWANDGQALYLRVQWQDVATKGSVQMDTEFPAKLSVLIDDDKISTFTRGGCWAVCHDDQTRMASAKDDTREKYLARSRTKIRRSGGGDALRPQEQLDKMLAEDQYLELWQAGLKPGAPADVVDGYILEKRHMREKSVVTAKSSYDNGLWTVELNRPLKSPGAGYKNLKPGTTYTVGLSLHEDHAAGRFHHVSWEYSLVLDSGKADFVAARH